MQHFPKNCFHFPESSVKFAISTKNEVLKFGEVRSSSSTEILICNPAGDDHDDLELDEAATLVETTSSS